METQELGATFSHTHLKYLKLDINRSLTEFRNVGFKWMRVGCYWRDIEKEKGKFNFTEVDEIVKFCEKNNIRVILTIGMKAPRYPEYYFPKWLNKNFRYLDVIKTKDKELLGDVTNFIGKSMSHFKKYNSIKVWQIENEPLDPSGEKYLRISKEFLENEVKLARKIDPTRKIMINLWGNDLFRRKWYSEAAKLADIVGLDVYMKVPIVKFNMFKFYSGPANPSKLKTIVEEIRDLKKEIAIAELQTEPWEFGEIVTKSEVPKSFKPEDFERNIEYVSKFKPKFILLWGFEYWLWRKENGYDNYFEEAKKAIKIINK